MNHVAGIPCWKKRYNSFCFREYYQYYSILLNITQYYQYYSLSHAKVTLKWIISDPGYYASVTNITQYYQYYPLLHNITNQIFTNITQYYISNITQYSLAIGGVKYQYYSILPILLNIPYSILKIFLIVKNVLFQFNMCQIALSIFLIITSQLQYSSIFLNITWATWMMPCYESNQRNVIFFRLKCLLNY